MRSVLYTNSVLPLWCWRFRGVLLLTLLGTFWSLPRAYASGCQIGFLTGSTPSIDGALGANEWSDASVLQSGNPCLDPLRDWAFTFAPNTDYHNFLPVASNITASPVNINIFSKRDGSNLYLRFEVYDQTKNAVDKSQAACGTPTPACNKLPLSLGEKISIELDPQHVKGSQLPNGGDFRLDVTHKWSPATLQTTFYTSTLPADPFGCNLQSWALYNNTGSIAGTGIQAALGVFSDHYVVEIGIPFSALGGTPSPQGVGIAFAIVNDLGYTESDNSVDATGAAFPSGLPITNNPSFPSDPIGCGDWLVPNNWADGTFSQPAGDVTISSVPANWNSDALTVFSCGTTPNYQYYPDSPCKLTIQAQLDNSGPAQSRNILYLWGDFGTGQFSFKYVQLKQNVMVPGGGGPVTSDLWDKVPKNLPEHPCVRVYILPATLLARFSANDIETRFDTPGFTAADLEATYGLGQPQWTQKNISVAPSPNQNGKYICPFGCGIASLYPRSRPVPLAFATVFTPLLSWESAPQTPEEATAPPRSPILWSSKEAASYERQNVFVQVQSFCVAKPQTTKTPRYNFIEPCGGVLKVVSLDLLKQLGGVPFQFNANNSAKVERTVYMKLDVRGPSGVQLPTIHLDLKPRRLGPKTTQAIQGVVGIVRHKWCFHTGGGFATVLLLGLATFGLIVFRKRDSGPIQNRG